MSWIMFSAYYDNHSFSNKTTGTKQIWLMKDTADINENKAWHLVVKSWKNVSVCSYIGLGLLKF